MIDVRVPDIGDFTDVPVIEVHVAPGDPIAPEDPLVTLESDKATMDVPAPVAGTVGQLRVKVGDRVSEGSVLLTVEEADPAARAPAEDAAGPAEDAPGPAEDAPGPAEDAVGPAEDAPPAAAASEAPRSPTEPRSQPRDRGEGAPPAKSVRDADAGAAAVVREAPPDGPVVVLGAGPGGYTAAFRAADLGLETVLVERDERLGGVCLNVGCIPSKALLHAARVLAEVREMADHGIRFAAPELDLDALRAYKQGAVDRLVKGLDGLAKARKVRVVHGEARLASRSELAIANGEPLSFGQCIIAAGSEPIALPGQPDDPRIIDSTGALELPCVPRRMLVVGGGIIGLELATVYDALGAAVTVVELTDGLMPGCDRDLVAPLQKRIAKRYERILTGTRVEGMTAREEAIRVTLAGDGGTVEEDFDLVLVAVGRRPNGRAIDPERAGIEVDERGFVPTDAARRTNVATIFAIGDVTGGPMLAHKATHEAKVAAEAAAGQAAAFDARSIPSVAYTDPEVAWTGLTETEAGESGTPYETAVFPWAASGRAIAMGRDEGFTKLLLEPDTKRILGAGIVGVQAGDLIAEVAHAIEMGADAEDVALTVHPHPTLSETVGLAAEVGSGSITDLPPRRRRR